jgi:outer membrane protein
VTGITLAKSLQRAANGGFFRPMKRFSLILVVLLFSTPMYAADRFFDVTGWASWVDPNSEGTFDVNSTDRFDVNFDGTLGYGAGVNIFFGDRISTELSVIRVQPEASLAVRGRAVRTAAVDVEMIPITAVLQWHFAPNSRIDPYIGAGAAYITFGDVDSPADLGDISVGEVDSDYLGLVVNGGVSIGLSDRFAIVGDIKYVPTGASATGFLQDGTKTTIDINPVIASAGLSIRF